MKDIFPNISAAPRAERPFPDKKILWGSQDGGQARFPTRASAYERMYSGDPVPLKEFGCAVLNAEERIWIVDEYLFMPDSGDPETRIDKILTWLQKGISATDIRLLTRPHREISDDCLNKFQNRAREINSHAPKRTKECRIEIRMHLTRDCNFIHDRFAVVDDELWHFGATAGGFHSRVSAASRGWRAADHGAIDFFEEIWRAGR